MSIYPDCPYGVNNIPTEEEKMWGVCMNDGKQCWNSICTSWDINCGTSCLDEDFDKSVSDDGVLMKMG
jgi:hypothetical protein